MKISNLLPGNSSNPLFSPKEFYKLYKEKTQNSPINKSELARTLNNINTHNPNTPNNLFSKTILDIKKRSNIDNKQLTHKLVNALNNFKTIEVK